MKAEIEKRGVVLRLEMSEKELSLIYDGIGRTSIHSRMESGMSRESAYAVDRLYAAIRTTLEKQGDD